MDDCGGRLASGIYRNKIKKEWDKRVQSFVTGTTKSCF